MQTPASDMGSTRCLRLLAGGMAVAFALLCSTCLDSAAEWWHQVRLPMMQTRYETLCGNASECYPEIGEFISMVFTGAAAMGAALIAGCLAGVSLFAGKLLHNQHLQGRSPE